MTRLLSRAALPSAVAFAIALQAAAQMSEPPKVESTSLPRERKAPSLFHRPGRKAPDQQLEYARELETQGRLRRAARQYNALVHQWHESREAVDAQMGLARLLEKRGRYHRAFDEYQYMVENYAGLFPYDEVLDRQFRLANEIAATRHFDFLFLPGVAAPELAVPLLEQLVENAPRWERAAEVQLRIARLYEDDGREEEAIRAYRGVLERYGESAAAEEAAYRLARCQREVALARPNNEAGLREASEAFADLLMAYPDHPRKEDATACLAELRLRLSQMAFERAVYYDRILKRPESALLSYQGFLRNFPASEQAAEAARRVGELKKELNKDVSEL